LQRCACSTVYNGNACVTGSDIISRSGYFLDSSFRKSRPRIYRLSSEAPWIFIVCVKKRTMWRKSLIS